MSDGTGLFAGTFGRGAVGGLVSSAAWFATLLEVEAALARAAAAVGAITSDSAVQIARACSDLASYDVTRLARDAASSGNPVVPLVALLRERVSAPARPEVHFGATSQDVLDTAMMMLAQRALAVLATDLGTAAGAAADLARIHRDSPMIGRTLMQAALPTTFGLKAAVWMNGLDGAVARADLVGTSLPVQYGGPVGTLASAGEWGVAIRTALAEELGLVAKPLAWHTNRAPMLDLAGVLGGAAGAVATTALDVVLLAQSEIGEVSEGVAGRGTSSSISHKHNPIAAISARACTLRVPGLVATLMAASAQEQERAAGAWHAEWETLGDLLRLVGSGASWLADSLGHLEVHADVMRSRALKALADNGLGEDLAARIGPAGALVDAALAERAGRPA